MIVNPQFYNYRLIIGSLVIAIVILGSFSYSSYTTLNDYQEFIEQEKSLVQNELSEMITQYDAVDVENKNINQQLVITKQKINSVLDSVKSLKPNVSLVSRYKTQLSVLKLENKQVLERVKDLKNENQSLKEKTNIVETKLDETRINARTLETKNNTLSKSNLDLKKDLELAKQLTITNVKALAIKKVTSKKITSTDYAKRAQQMQVSFTIAKNNFTEKGKKDIYIQILNPRNNVVSDKGSVSFGKESLIYSKKATINYINQNLEVSSLIKTSNNEKLLKGIYFISVFHDAKRIGKTSIELK